MSKDHFFFYSVLIFGFLLKIYFFSIGSDPYLNWYRPFLEFSSQNLSLDPWQSWLESGGNTIAFPYGYSMWLSFMPFILIFNFIELSLIYFFVICIFELITCYIVFKLNNNNKSSFLFLWISPIVLTATYLLGFNDIIPATFIIISLYFLKKQMFFVRGFYSFISFIQIEYGNFNSFLFNLFLLQ